MRALLDVNVLIALLDADHTHHERARGWFAEHASEGWASCAITQNGCIRIMSNISYPNALPIRTIVARLAGACRHKIHEFWACDLSILADASIDAEKIHGPRQLTDLYLLALAVQHGGRFVSFDAAVPITAVRNAAAHHLVVL